MLAVNPEVILMDEPASALDPIATSKIEDLIGELKADYTVVIVTHSMQQAARISDITAFFHLGEIVECGTTTRSSPSRAKSEPKTTSPAASASARLAAEYIAGPCGRLRPR